MSEARARTTGTVQRPTGFRGLSQQVTFNDLLFGRSGGP